VQRGVSVLNSVIQHLQEMLWGDQFLLIRLDSNNAER